MRSSFFASDSNQQGYHPCPALTVPAGFSQRDWSHSPPFFDTNAPHPSHFAIGYLRKETIMVTVKHKNELRAALAKAFDDFASTLSSFGEPEVNEIPFTGSWTPSQVAVHIIMATDGVPDGNTSPAHRPYDSYLPRIRPWWEDLNQKFKSPEPLLPDEQERSKKILLEELERVRTKDLVIAEKTDLSAVCLDFELPSIGYLTRFEWLWFIEMHLRRHHYQLDNMLKAFADPSTRTGAN